MPRGKSAREFAIDLKKFGKVTREQARTIFRVITLELDQAVVLATPVDEGRARGNWFPSLNQPATGTSDRKDPTGAAAISDINETVASAELGDLIWMTNNLPYILPLENGSSKQAREGMVDVNLNRVAAQYGGKVER